MFTFIDLFCGIGGFRVAAESLGGRCVFSSDIDRGACDIYQANFGERPSGDITKIPSSVIPDHDVLFGGFPCQAFSSQGHKKGFEDTRGTLVWEIARIVKEKRPVAFVLENVEGLLSHEGGKSFSVILALLGKASKGKKGFNLFKYDDSLGYFLFWRVLSSKDFSLPQDRRRVVIIGFRPDIGDCSRFVFPVGGRLEGFSHATFGDVEEAGDDYAHVWLNRKQLRQLRYGIVDGTCTSSFFVGRKGISNTMTRGYKPSGFNTSYFVDCDGGNVIRNLEDVFSGKIRSRVFTVRECARLQGFPDSFVFPVSQAQAYKAIGNSVPVPMVKAVTVRVLEVLGERIRERRKTSL